MAEGLVNLNRFRHGRAIKRDSKQKADLQGKNKSGGTGLNLAVRIDELTFGFLMFGSHNIKRRKLDALSQVQAEIVIFCTGIGDTGRGISRSTGKSLS